MPINISYQPSAAAIGGAGLVAGQGDYARWLNQFLQQNYQFSVGAAQNAQQMQLSRMNALSQIAAQQQQQANDQAFKLQTMPMEAQLEQQKQYGQQMLQAQIGDQASARDFSEQQQLYSQQGQQALDLAAANNQYKTAADATDFAQQQQLTAQRAQQQQDLANAQQQAELGRQQQMADYNDKIKQGQLFQQTFQNPFQQHLKNVQQGQQQGYTFTQGPGGQQEQVDGLKNDIANMQQAVASGRSFPGTIQSEFMNKVGQLNSIIPSQPPPPTVKDQLQKQIVMDFPGLEGTPVTVNPKTGEPTVLKGYKADSSAMLDAGAAQAGAEKARGVSLDNQIKERKVNLHRTEWVDKRVDSQMKGNPQIAMLMQAAQMGDPNAAAQVEQWRQSIQQYYEQEYDKSAANTPSGVSPVANPNPQQQQAQQPAAQPPQPGIVGQAVQGAMNIMGGWAAPPAQGGAAAPAGQMNALQLRMQAPPAAGASGQIGPMADVPDRMQGAGGMMQSGAAPMNPMTRQPMTAHSAIQVLDGLRGKPLAHWTKMEKDAYLAARQVIEQTRTTGLEPAA